MLIARKLQPPQGPDMGSNAAEPPQQRIARGEGKNRPMQDNWRGSLRPKPHSDAVSTGETWGPRIHSRLGARDGMDGKNIWVFISVA